MAGANAITCLFVDIGGVLLTAGWDHHARERVATNFKLELPEMEDRHHLTFDTYEEGELTLENYFGRVVFHKKRSLPVLSLGIRPSNGALQKASALDSLSFKRADIDADAAARNDRKHCQRGISDRH
jgi:hypothetical protein